MPVRRYRILCGVAPVFLGAACCVADIDPNSGINFVRVGAVGNAPWMGTNPPMLPGQDMALGRGRVDYEYNIGRFEVNTQQWTAFFNAAFDRPASDRLPWLGPPSFWGATGTTPQTPGGLRWMVPAGNEMRPVGNISWRMAAMYCNWLHNDKSTDRSAFLNGAYDVSQFSGTDFFTDQLTHNANARYWIPTWDEWIKAAHYDPNKSGPGQGGYWLYSTRSDTAPIAGPPGAGQANYGWRDGTNSQWTTLLGAYPQTQSPWGLLDTSGGTAEWTEGTLVGFQNSHFRVYEGSHWGSAPGFVVNDSIYAATAADYPAADYLNLGFRIASAVPSPPSAFVLVSLAALQARRRRRDATASHSFGDGDVLSGGHLGTCPTDSDDSART